MHCKNYNVSCPFLNTMCHWFRNGKKWWKHPRWPLWLPSWIQFPSIRRQMLGSIHLIFLWLIGGDQLCRSSEMAATAAILDLVSVDYSTNARVDWSYFSVAYWGWLEEGSIRWSALPLIQDRHCDAAILDLVSVDFLTNAWVDLSDFFSWLIGATGGRFLSMTSAAAHSTWLLRQRSWIWFPSIIWQTPASTGPIFWWLIGGHQFSPYFTSPQALSSIYLNFPLGGICHALRSPCLI
jgi:hypothetical protein